MEMESYKNGKLLYIGAQKGEKIPVNALLCIIGEEGKVDINKIVAASKGGAPSAGKETKADQEVVTPAESNAEQLAVTPDRSQAAAGVSQNGDGRVKASPLAKKLADEKGIDISKVPGSGD